MVFFLLGTDRAYRSLVSRVVWILESRRRQPSEEKASPWSRRHSWFANYQYRSGNCGRPLGRTGYARVDIQQEVVLSTRLLYFTNIRVLFEGRMVDVQNWAELSQQNTKQRFSTWNWMKPSYSFNVTDSLGERIRELCGDGEGFRGECAGAKVSRSGTRVEQQGRIHCALVVRDRNYALF